METTSERSVSGRALVIAGLLFALVITATGVMLGPGLREKVRQDESPRTLREPIAAGIHAGEPWEAIGRFDGTANCVELRYLSDVLDRACDAGSEPIQVTDLPDGGPTVAYGIAPEDEDTFTLDLDTGEQIDVPVRAGELGFPVGFWATELPAGARPAE